MFMLFTLNDETVFKIKLWSAYGWHASFQTTKHHKFFFSQTNICKSCCLKTKLCLCQKNVSSFNEVISTFITASWTKRFKLFLIIVGIEIKVTSILTLQCLRDALVGKRDAQSVKAPPTLTLMHVGLVRPLLPETTNVLAHMAVS